MNFFREMFFSFFAWMATTFGLGMLALFLVAPGLPDPKPSNTTVSCLRVEKTDTIDKETGYIDFTCIKAK